MYRSKKKSKFRPSSVLFAGLIVLAIGLIYGGYRLYQSHKTSLSLKTADGKQVNLSPPTPSDLQANDAHKNALAKQNAQTNTPGTGVSNPSSGALKPSTVVITSTSAAGIRAYVNGVFENNGTCTASAVQGVQTYTKTSVGFENVSYTQCAPLNWDTPLGSGSWTITVSYKSTTTESKQTTTLEVN
jgi:hypothetical protein